MDGLLDERLPPGFKPFGRIEPTPESRGHLLPILELRGGGYELATPGAIHNPMEAFRRFLAGGGTPEDALAISGLITGSSFGALRPAASLGAGGRVKRMELSDDQLQKLRDLWAKPIPSAEIASEFGMSRPTLAARALEAGLEPRRRGPISPHAFDDEAGLLSDGISRGSPSLHRQDIISDRAGGMKIEVLAEKYGTDPRNIQRLLQSAYDSGEAKRPDIPRGPRRREFTEDQLAAFRAGWSSGTPRPELEKLIGAKSGGAMQRLIDELGLAPRPRGRPRTND